MVELSEKTGIKSIVLHEIIQIAKDNDVEKELLFMKKFDNFKSALNNLKDIFTYDEPYGNVEIAGIVGLYEICFEQAWKAMKDILISHGYAGGETGLPRMILKTAYKAGMISDEELWLNALISRNNVAHAYNEAIALDIINQTKSNYYNMFVELEKTIEKDWM